jgi:hypothetical protein
MARMSLDIDTLKEVYGTEQDGGALLESLNALNKILLSSKGVELTAEDASVSVSKGRVELTGEKVFINADLENIFFNGVYRLNPELSMMIPSTIATPMPVFKQAFTERISSLLSNITALREVL